MAHYRAARPLCELNLSGQSPLALPGGLAQPADDVSDCARV